MALALWFSRARGLLCLACVVTVGLFIVTGGCPGANTSDPNDPNSAAQTGDPNASGDTNGAGTGNTNGTGDTNGSGTTGGDTSGSGTTGGDTSGSGTTGGDTNGSGTSSTTPTPPTSIALTALAKTGDAVPGQATGVTFTTFTNPVIDAKGRVAFWGLYQGTGAVGTGGLYVWDGTALQKVVDDDPNSAGIVPGRTAASYFQYDPNEPDISWGAGDRLLFCALIQPASKDAGATVSGVYRWRATDGNVARVTDRDQVAAVFPDVIHGDVTQFQGGFTAPNVSDEGLASFGVRYAYLRDPNQFPGFDAFVGYITPAYGVFTSNGTTVSKLADDSSKKTGGVPEQPADAYYSTIAPLTALNPTGDLLFQGAYNSSTTSGRGVYLERAGTAYRVIDSRTGGSWPGLAVGAQFSPARGIGYRLAIGSGGQIATFGNLVVSGTTNTTVLLWDWTAGDWTVLYGPGSTPASALLTGVNDAGQVVILAGASPYLTSRTAQTRLDTTLPAQLQGATVAWVDNGGSINDNGRAVLSYTNNTKPGLALWTGEQLLVIADAQLGTPPNSADVRTISAPERDRPGRSGLLNNADEATFRVVLADSTEAIYLAQGK